MCGNFNAISDDAERIADFWAKAYAEDKYGTEAVSLKQRIHYQALHELYSFADAMATVHSMRGHHEAFYNALGSLLETRNRVRGAFEELIWPEKYYIGGKEEVKHLVEALQDEAGVLRALAIQFKASRALKAK